MLEFDEALPQDFTFIGQWGVTADRELKDIFWMRSRHYDAQLGRFLSFDPLGTSAFNIYYKTFDFQQVLKFKIQWKYFYRRLSQMVNRNMSTVLCLCQNWFSCETIHMKMVFICTFIFMQIKLIFIYCKCFA